MQDIYVDDIGKGFPLVLVHGFLGSSLMWEPQINYFKKNYRVLTPDLPGFGKSNKVESCSSIVSMAETIIKALKKKKIEKFYLLGHSMGGMVVQEIIKIIGEQIPKLICYGTGPIGEIPGRFESMDQSREKLKKMGLKITAQSIAKTWFVKEEKAKYFYLCSNASKATNLKTADNALVAMKNWNGLENLKNINNPTLIVWGNHDKSYNFNQIEILNKNIKNSEIKIFKGCAHNVHLEKTDEFNACIEFFLKKKINTN
jgi:pimeloyl-ACP methyl ester carboxylesterase